MTSPIEILVKVVDDAVVDLEFIVDQLNENPIFKVSGYSNPESFKESMNKDVNLVITDVRIPSYNVYETVEYLRYHFPGIYIIVISAHFTEDILKRLIRCKVDDVVEKDSFNWVKHLRNEIGRAHV